MRAHSHRLMAVAAVVLGAGCAGLMKPAPTVVTDPPRPLPPDEAPFAQATLGSMLAFVRCSGPDCQRPTPKTLTVAPAARQVQTALSTATTASPTFPDQRPAAAALPAAPISSTAFPPSFPTQLTPPIPAAAVDGSRRSPARTGHPSPAQPLAPQPVSSRIPQDLAPAVTIYFGFGAASLSPSDRVRLDEALRQQVQPVERISITGQTAGEPTKPANQALASARAAAVRSHLMFRAPHHTARIQLAADRPCCHASTGTPLDDPARRRVDVWFHPARSQL